MSKALHILSIAVPILSLALTLCDYNSKKEKKNIPAEPVSAYLNHSDSAKYVGMNTCKGCHQKIYNTFIETGMGKSFDIATRKKSSADFTKASVFDKISDYHYLASWKNDSLFFKEYRVQQGDTIHSRTEQVNYIIGSGQHTNSHIQNVNGYFTQMPMTFYTQKKHWDLPPGFEGGFNTHFTRKIGLECMSCHNGYPDFVVGSENKYRSVPRGIDCERCHGPGSAHVQQRSTTGIVDTSLYIDYSIVNPAKLSIDLQFDICQRCHLQGNAVLKEGKSFYDFKPGKKLSDFLSVFLPKYKGADDEFIMASHADRLKQSPCFIQSLKKAKDNKSLRPYKDAMTCITCHNPHVSVKHTNTNVFNDACNGCHKASGKSQLPCTDKNIVAARNSKPGHAPEKFKNCVSCHMPVSGATDIPHVSVHDHYIRKPVTEKEKEKIKTFLGLYSINEKNPDRLTRAKAYINQYSKFDQNPSFLDSAQALLKDDNIMDLYKNIRPLLELNFIKQDYKNLLALINRAGELKCLNTLFIKSSYDNADAWACYHVAEANYYTGNITNSLKWFRGAIKLAPYVLDFRNKFGSALAATNDMKAASDEFEFILKENPKHVSAYTNLGFIKLRQGFPAEAIRLYTIAVKIDPDYEPLLLNLAGYYAFQKDKKQAVIYLQRILKKNPGNQKAKMALQQVNSLI
ncbi:MAG: tetratricopeptide repeat protein [Bacteroidetes bacterium]|nr:tetratricopeptide repeat protein [Bacteroidota bacterium]